MSYYLMTPSEFHENLRAAKEHSCDGCGEAIEVGHPYDRIAVPPWLANTEADVDDEGRTIYVQLPREEWRWYVMRFHQGCYDRAVA